MHAPFHALFADPHAAEQAIMRLEALGVARADIRTFGQAARDHAGSFADSGAHAHAPERDHVGSFADSGAHAHAPERDHVGSFADSGAHAHAPERDRVGSFADSDRGRARLERELAAAGLDRDAVASAAAQVSAGALLVVVQAPAEQAAAVADALKG